MKRIDSHLHVLAKASAEFPRLTDDICPAEREEPVEKLLAEMEKHQVDQAVLVQMLGEEIEHHAYLRHCLNAYPDRFLGIGLIPPQCPDPEDHMDRLAADGRIIGFRLHTLGGPRDPFAPTDVRQFATYRIWHHAAERDYVMWLYMDAIDAHLTAYVVDAFPQVRVVFNHLGMFPGEGKFYWDEKQQPRVINPDFFTAMHTVHRLARYDNVALHLSGQYSFSTEPYPYRNLEGVHRYLLHGFGPQRLMWATDAPWIYKEPGYGPTVNIIKELMPYLSEEDYAAIMGGTAQQFLRFP